MSNRLKEIAERAEKATPGPWHLRHTDIYGGIEIGNQPYLDDALSEEAFDSAWAEWSKRDIAICELSGDMRVATEEREHPNAEFIAHAREDIPFLLSVVAQLQRIIDDPELYALEQRAKGYRADGGDR